eukprot:440074_1
MKKMKKMKINKIKMNKKKKNAPNPSENEENEENENKQNQNEQEEEEEQEEQEEQEECKVPLNNIPNNINEDWVGYDTTHNFIIDNSGRILIDHTLGQSANKTADWRNKKYHQHKKYVDKQTKKMISKSRSLTVLFTTNFERAGEPRNVALQMLSPMLYETKYADLKLAIIYLFDYLLIEMQRRSRIESDVTVVDDDQLKAFIFNFREQLVSNQQNILSQCYDNGLLSLFNTNNINDVVQSLQQSVDRVRISGGNANVVGNAVVNAGGN